MVQILRALLLLIFVFATACGDRNFMDQTKIDDSILKGAPVASDDPIFGTTVLIAQNFEDISKPNADRVTYSLFGICSGVVIAPQYIVTAAHCAKNFKNSRVVLTTNSQNEVLKQNIYQIISAEIPQKYHEEKKLESAQFRKNGTKPQPSDKSNLYDIAVLKLDREMKSVKWDKSYFVKTKTSNSEGQKDYPVTLSGFGRNSELIIPDKTKNPQVTGVLQKAYRNIPVELALQQTLIINQKNESGVCIGDSGGPMFIRREGQQYLQAIAIAVYKYKDVDEDYIYNQCFGDAMFLNLDFYKDWIKEILLR